MLSLLAAGGLHATSVQDAFAHLYNFDFPGAHRIADGYIAKNPSDPMGYCVRGSAYLFSELDRLLILESEFFEDDKKLSTKRKLKADPVIRERFYAAVGEAKSRANARLAANPKDENSLFALSITSGLVTDYASFIEKRHLDSLALAKESQSYATRLLQLDPNYTDAYLTNGISEYLLSSLPFFVRWFVHFDGVEASKPQAVQNLERVAQSGKYLGPFAKILLAVIYLREKQPAKSQALLIELHRAYPENPLFRKELEKIASRSVPR
jgi:hypothetical protein